MLPSCSISALPRDSPHPHAQPGIELYTSGKVMMAMLQFCSRKMKAYGGVGVFANLKTTSLWRLNRTSVSVLYFIVTSVRRNRHTLMAE